MPDADLTGAIFADSDGLVLRLGWFRQGGLAGCGLGRARAG